VEQIGELQITMQGKRPGVYYRLPSGVVIDDCVVWDGLDLQRIADDLGARLDANPNIPDLADIQIVRWEHVREDLAAIVSSRMRSLHGVLGLSHEDLGFRYGTFSPVTPGQWVVVLTGSVLTGRTATTLLRVLRRMEAHPVAVATVIDGRTDCGVPLSTLHGPVPVISCLEHTLVVDEAAISPDDVVDIDAAGGEAAPARRPAREISTERFMSWLESRGDSGAQVGTSSGGAPAAVPTRAALAISRPTSTWAT
jgi:hypothetical protein